MIGILLAGGSGTRLYPITKIVNKHILPVFDRPMIFYPLQTLVNSGIKNVIVVCGSPHDKQIRAVVKRFPGIGKINCSYVIQPKALGMADAIRRCNKLVGNENIMVIAGDNIYKKGFQKEVDNFERGALSFLRQVKDPARFGVPIYNKKRLVKIKEKPANPKTNWVVTGPHFFDKQVFRLIDILKPSSRGELEITDLNNKYINQGLLILKKRTDWWIDAGTFDSLLKASLEIKRRINQ